MAAYFSDRALRVKAGRMVHRGRVNGLCPNAL